MQKSEDKQAIFFNYLQCKFKHRLDSIPLSKEAGTKVFSSTNLLYSVLESDASSDKGMFSFYYGYLPIELNSTSFELALNNVVCDNDINILSWSDYLDSNFDVEYSVYILPFSEENKKRLDSSNICDIWTKLEANIKIKNRNQTELNLTEGRYVLTISASEKKYLNNFVKYSTIVLDYTPLEVLKPTEVYNYTTIHGEPILFGVQQIDSSDESIFLNYMQCTNLYELNYADQKVSLATAAGSIKIEKTLTSSKVKLNLNTLSNSTGEIKVTYGYYPSQRLGNYLGLDSDKINYNNETKSISFSSYLKKKGVNINYSVYVFLKNNTTSDHLNNIRNPCYLSTSKENFTFSYLADDSLERSSYLLKYSISFNVSALEDGQ